MPTSTRVHTSRQRTCRVKSRSSLPALCPAVTVVFKSCTPAGDTILAREAATARADQYCRQESYYPTSTVDPRGRTHHTPGVQCTRTGSVCMGDRSVSVSAVWYAAECSRLQQTVRRMLSGTDCSLCCTSVLVRCLFTSTGAVCRHHVVHPLTACAWVTCPRSI